MTSRRAQAQAGRADYQDGGRLCPVFAAGLRRRGNSLARVLIADDAVYVRKVVAQMLVDAGHTVVAEAATGDEAVDLYHETRPDAAVIDVNMPGLDGIAAAEQIRRAYPAARILLASVLLPETRIRRVVAITHAAPLRKPFDAAGLIAALEDLLGDR